jgi:hypothetical protein
MQKNDKNTDAPLSEKTIPTKLSEIQKRCTELLTEPDSLTDLHLVDFEGGSDGSDPYNHQ